MRRAPRQASTGITQTHSSMSWRVPSSCRSRAVKRLPSDQDRKSTRLNSSHGYISYAVFCLKKKKPKHPLAAPNAAATHPPLRVTTKLAMLDAAPTAAHTRARTHLGRSAADTPRPDPLLTQP